MKRAYYSDTINDFLKLTKDEILVKHVKQSFKNHYF